MYQVTKTYGHDLGLSAAFRQWRAESHCNKIHGYALSFKFTFQSETLNLQNWVIDFGGLHLIKNWLIKHFDHKTLVAQDDPFIETFEKMHLHNLISLVEMENVGCEAFAKEAFIAAQEILKNNHRFEVKLVAVEVREHGANSAIYFGE